MPLVIACETVATLPGAPPASRQESIRLKKGHPIVGKASSILHFDGMPLRTGSGHKDSEVQRGRSSSVYWEDRTVKAKITRIGFARPRGKKVTACRTRNVRIPPLTLRAPSL